MPMPLSRAMSVATVAYAVFALAKPRHVGNNMTADVTQRSGYDIVGTTYGCRDLVIGSLGVFAQSPQAVRAAMLGRVAFDLADAVVLGPRADAGSARTKILAATLGWAALNSTALALDTRRERSRGALV